MFQIITAIIVVFAAAKPTGHRTVRVVVVVVELL